MQTATEVNQSCKDAVMKIAEGISENRYYGTKYLDLPKWQQNTIWRDAERQYAVQKADAAAIENLPRADSLNYPSVYQIAAWLRIARTVSADKGIARMVLTAKVEPELARSLPARAFSQPSIAA